MRLTADQLVGSWELRRWENRLGEQVSCPLGDSPLGLLIYSPDGSMAVQITAPDRAQIPTPDPLGGSTEQRAAAYSTCLAYCGRWDLRDGAVVHTLRLSLFPNWTGAEQVRQVELSGDELVLRTAPIPTPDGDVVGELRWVRACATDVDHPLGMLDTR